MDFVPFENTVKVSIEFTWRGQVVVVTLHLKRADTVSIPEMVALAGAIKSWWGATGKQLATADLVLQQVVVTELSAASAAGIVSAASPPVAGTAAGVSVSNNVAVVVSFLTDLRGRNFRGRMYLPGFPAAKVSGNTIDATFAASVVTITQTLFTDVGTLGWTPVVASRFYLNEPRDLGVTTPITAIAVENRIDTQRRRLPGYGI